MTERERALLKQLANELQCVSTELRDMPEALRAVADCRAALAGVAGKLEYMLAGLEEATTPATTQGGKRA